MTLAGMLAPFMQLILDCSTAPEQFLEGVIIYMHKKGDPKDTNNYTQGHHHTVECGW